jgi:flavodoxin
VKRSECLHDLVVRRGDAFQCKACGERVKVKKASKYHNEKVTIDNIVFDSRREGRRYQDLKLAQQIGQIRNLKLQPRFYFFIGKTRIFSYYADFSYVEVQTGQTKIEDSKGYRKDKVYRLKKNLIEAQHKIRIIET